MLLLPSGGQPVDSPSGASAGEASSAGRLAALTLACSGLLEPLRLWWLRCLLLRGLGLWEPVFTRTTVLSSSELKSELSEELWSGPTVGSWIWSVWESCDEESGETRSDGTQNRGMIT